MIDFKKPESDHDKITKIMEERGITLKEEDVDRRLKEANLLMVKLNAAMKRASDPSKMISDNDIMVMAESLEFVERIGMLEVLYEFLKTSPLAESDNSFTAGLIEQIKKRIDEIKGE